LIYLLMYSPLQRCPIGLIAGCPFLKFGRTAMTLPTQIGDEWPTFRGRRLTAKEREFGLIITPISRKDVQTARKLGLV
jgi:hypothetical protein